MFGRRKSSDPDVVAAARRRLAVMAAELEAKSEGPSPADPTDRDWASISAAAQPTSLRPEPTAASPDEPSSHGRHADRTAVALRERGRWEITPHQVTIIALAVVAAVAVAAFLVMRSAPNSHPVPVATQRVLPDSPAQTVPTGSVPSSAVPAPTGAGATTSAGSPAVVVDVAGRVRQPGIVELAGGSRVVDALQAAGGVRPGTDTASLNLARLLVDGEQIVVGLDIPDMGTQAAPSGSTSTGAAIAPVNLNTATEEQLETLPGIGPVTAAAILAWRTEMGAFSSVDELLEVSGIGDATLADLEPYVFV